MHSEVLNSEGQAAETQDSYKLLGEPEVVYQGHITKDKEKNKWRLSRAVICDPSDVIITSNLLLTTCRPLFLKSQSTQTEPILEPPRPPLPEEDDDWSTDENSPDMLFVSVSFSIRTPPSLKPNF